MPGRRKSPARRKTPAQRAKRVARKADRELRAAAANPWVERMARAGYVARGLLYGGMGALALALVVSPKVTAVDQRGALFIISRTPGGAVVVAAALAALLAYAAWGFIRAVWDPLKRGSDIPGLMARLGFIWSALNYLALVLFGVTLLLGATRTNGAEGIHNLVSSVLSAPGGWAVLIIAGVIGTIAGLGQFWDAYKAAFRQDIKRNQMGAAERTAVDTLGRVGMVARGVVFTMLGWFILEAGLTRDADRSENIGQVFGSLAAAPLGHLILSLVALGFIALALHSLALAYWIRMPDPQ